MRADGEAQLVGEPCFAAGARAFPRCWNIGEGRRARGLRFPSAILPCVRVAPCASKGRTEEPAQTRVTALSDPTSPLRITLPRPLHLPSGGAPKRASRLRGNDPLALPLQGQACPRAGGGQSRSPVWGPFIPPRRDRDAPTRISRLPFEQMPRSLGTCGHGPSCSLPSVVDRRPQRGRWY